MSDSDKLQSLLILTTVGPTVREKVVGVSHESGYEAADATRDRFQGSQGFVDISKIASRSLNTPFYPTVLHAMGAGWKLLCKPEALLGDKTVYKWWLVK